jgi:hypothetical protein
MKQVNSPVADVMIERPDQSVDVVWFASVSEAKAEYDRLRKLAETDTNIQSLSWSVL